MTAAVPPGVGPASLREFFRAVGVSIRRSLPRTIIFALIGAAVGYVVNVWWIARRYEGTNVPDGAPVTTSGNWFSGTLFWTVASIVVFGIIGYWNSVGNQRFWREVRGFPSTLAGYFRTDGTRVWVHFLWGVAMFGLLSNLVSPAIGGMLAIGVLVMIPSILGRLVFTTVSSSIRAVANQFQPDKAHAPPALVSVAVGAVGAAVALALAFVIDDTASQLIVAAVAAGAALTISYYNNQSGTALLLVVLGAAAIALAVVLGDASVALADDGGWKECGEDWGKWLDCEGSSRVLRNAGLGSLASGLGAGTGSAIGGAIASAPDVRDVTAADGTRGIGVDRDRDGVTDGYAWDTDGDGVLDKVEHFERPPQQTVHTTDDGTTVETTTWSDGTSQTTSTSPDGTTTTTYSDPDGTTTTSTTQTQPDGTTVDTTTWPDGTSQTASTSPDGTVTTSTTSPDGTTSTTVDRPPVQATSTEPDGTVVTTSTDPDDGTSVTTRQHPDGTTTTTYSEPDGTTTTSTTQTQPDGTTVDTTTWPDGTSQTASTSPDGTVTTSTTSPDGTTSTTVDRPPVQATSTEPDGTVVTTSTDPDDGTSVTTRQHPDGTTTTTTSHTDPETGQVATTETGPDGTTTTTYTGLDDGSTTTTSQTDAGDSTDTTTTTDRVDTSADDGSTITTTEQIGADGNIERSETVRTNPDGSTEVVGTTERIPPGPGQPGGTRITEQGLPDRTEYDDGTVEYEEPFDRTNETYNDDDGSTTTTTERIGTDGKPERSETVRTNPDGSTEVVGTTERIPPGPGQPGGTRITEQGLPDRTEYDDGTVEYEEPFDRTNETYNDDDGSTTTTTERIGTDGKPERSETVRTNPDGSTEVVGTTERIPPGPGQPGGTRITEQGLPDRTEYDDGTVEYEEPFDRTNETYNDDDGSTTTTTEHIGTDGKPERSETVRTNPDGSTEVVGTTERIPPGPGQPGGTRITEQGLPDRTEYDDGTVEYEEPFDRTNETYNDDDGSTTTTTEHIGTDGKPERSETVRTNPDGSTEVVGTTERVGGLGGQPSGTRITETGLPDRTEYDDGTVEYEEPFDRTNETYNDDDGSTDTTTEHIGRDGSVERSETVRTNPDGSTEVVGTTERIPPGPGQPGGTRITEQGLPDRTEYDDGTVEYEEGFQRDVDADDGTVRAGPAGAGGPGGATPPTTTAAEPAPAGPTPAAPPAPDSGEAPTEPPESDRAATTPVQPAGPGGYEGVEEGDLTTTERVGADGNVERSETVRTNPDGSTEVVGTTERIPPGPGQPGGTRITEQGLPDRTEYDDGRIEYEEPFDRTNETYNDDDGSTDTTTERIGTDGAIERSETVRTDREGNTEVIRSTERVGGHGPEPAGTHIREPGLPDRTEYDDGRIEYEQPFDRTNETYNDDDGSTDTTTERIGTDGAIERSETVRTDREGNTEVIRSTERVGGHGPEPAGTHIREPGLPDRTEYDDGRIEYEQPFDRTNETYNDDDGSTDTTTERIGTDGAIERSETVRTDREGNTEVIRSTERVGGHGPEPAGTHIHEPGLPDRTEYDDGRIEYEQPFDRTNETYNDDDGSTDTTTERIGTDGKPERSETVRTDREGNTEVIRSTERVGGHGPEPAGTHIREPGLPDRTEYDDGRIEYEQPFDRTNETYNDDDGSTDTTTERIGTDGKPERSETVRTDREGNTEVIRSTERVGGHGDPSQPGGTRITEQGLPDRIEYDDGTVEYAEPFDRTNETPGTDQT